MKELQTFTNAEFGEIGIIQINGKEFFPAIETAEKLGYKNPYKAVLDHCKNPGVTNREVGVTTGTKPDGTPIRQVVEKKFIDEGNLYRLIIKSKLPSAERFERWIFDEVIPTIRKQGQYAICTTTEQVISVKERLQVARLVAFAPNSRLPAVKEILKPIIGDLPIETGPTQVTQMLIGNNDTIFETMSELIAEETAVVKKLDDDTFALDREAFKTAMQKQGFTYEQALKVLDDMGSIKKSSEGKRTCPVCTNGQKFRCVIYKIGN